MARQPSRHSRQNYYESNYPGPNQSGQGFIEYALLIILFAIVLLSIILILGDDLRTFINDLIQTWFPG
ncbi:MAG: hypothetical protein AAF639_15785 [Chloroflexota bacterium]